MLIIIFFWCPSPTIVCRSRWEPKPTATMLQLWNLERPEFRGLAQLKLKPAMLNSQAQQPGHPAIHDQVRFFCFELGTRTHTHTHHHQISCIIVNPGKPRWSHSHPASSSHSTSQSLDVAMLYVTDHSGNAQVLNRKLEKPLWSIADVPSSHL